MCQALALTVGSLPASKTHKSGRQWAFLPSSDLASPSLGTLTIVQSKRDTVSYAVAVEDHQVLFAKADGSEVYGVNLKAGRSVRCSCTGFCFKRTCKHLDAAVEMIADGVLDVCHA
ncbi:hypothetical protein [Limnoglobus roseus]|uniref:SWIM-type domain-containing protein n=1 Tax=Limnoglobus roseus TaxID=2598579 RepID=A0A5C1ANH0_9BACT|nr:hypothetical protein [Limnoglobus roseus]QEL20540.1 hypothetical protein PX52LOC_07645 [Limnoglobus roseus]